MPKWSRDYYLSLRRRYEPEDIRLVIICVDYAEVILLFLLMHTMIALGAVIPRS